MEDNQFKLLEKRVNTAISFIENLKTREKKLVKEREELVEKIAQLEGRVAEGEKKNDEHLRTQKYLREKIETILTRLEGLAGLYDESKPANAEKNDGQGFGFPTENPHRPRKKNTHGVIVEENAVDLTEERSKADGSSGGRGESTLFDNNPFIEV